ncbi:MAG: CAP domain-containing protein [Terracidiphilus sp.]|nr:CAP domain-containing protein [Terracidiphilus sp.]
MNAMRAVVYLSLVTAAWQLAGAQTMRTANRGDGVMPAAAEQLMALANRSRAQAGLAPLKWDESLAAAARAHTLRMASEGPISHRYGGEAGLSDRAAHTGAHFDLIEENVAIGPDPATIHEEWMQSPGHRANLLNGEVNRVGIAVVSARGVLYATADYAQGVEKLSAAQVEARIAELIRVSGVEVRGNPAQARATCAVDRGLPTAQGGPQATFVARWQDADLSHLPDSLTERLASGRYHMAAVGSCPAQNVDGGFTSYRVAVLLY